MKKVFPPFTALLGHQVKNIFFAFIKKIFLQTLIEISYKISTLFLSSGTPWNHPTNKLKKFTYEVLGIKIG